MDFLNDCLDKAKELFETAKEKTDKAARIGKQWYDIGALEARINKSYQALGRVSFENYKNDESAPDEVKALISQIESELETLQLAREELERMRASRLCPACSGAIAENAVFCSHCGQKLVYTEE